jgi:hypothetical protein
MKTPSRLLIGLALALGAGSAFAWHHGPRVHIGVGFGPFWGPYWASPWYYGPPVVAYPPAVIVAQPPAPTQYVERADPPQAGYWYYCETSRGYYPYVKDCPTGWKAVPPAPPPAK